MFLKGRSEVSDFYLAPSFSVPLHPFLRLSPPLFDE